MRECKWKDMRKRTGTDKKANVTCKSHCNISISQKIRRVKCILK